MGSDFVKQLRINMYDDETEIAQVEYKEDNQDWIPICRFNLALLSFGEVSALSRAVRDENLEVIFDLWERKGVD